MCRVATVFGILSKCSANWTHVTETGKQTITQLLIQCKFSNLKSNYHILFRSDLTNAIVYAFSVYTSIGYGTVSASTFSARLFTVFYAALGIPVRIKHCY